VELPGSVPPLSIEHTDVRLASTRSRACHRGGALCYDGPVDRPLLGAATLLLALAGACRLGTFVCEDDSDCADGGSLGVCEAAGACSFPDDTCPSGRRYGDRSPGDIAGDCVETVDTDTSSGSGDGSASTIDPATATTADDATTADTGDACPPDWWDCAWSRRVALDLPATAAETLSDVPVLVLLGVPRIDPDDAAGTGADLRFVDAEGTRIPHEIERWDPDGTSIVWIAVPTLGPGDGPRLWLYYGNPDATDDTEHGAVWSPEHAGVWHLQPGVVDATTNGGNGTAAGGVIDVEGHLAGAKEFFAVDDRIDVPPKEALDDAFLGGGTVSAWIRPDTWGGTSRGRIADKTAGAAGGWMFYVASAGGGEVRWRYGYEGGQVIWGAPGVVLDAWTHVAVTFDALVDTTPRFYVDGVEIEGYLDGAAPEGPARSDLDYTMVIGNSDVPDRWFDGRIDELRVERTVRSPEWIELQHRSMTDTLVVYSAPEQLEVVR